MHATARLVERGSLVELAHQPCDLGSGHTQVALDRRAIAREVVEGHTPATAGRQDPLLAADGRRLAQAYVDAACGFRAGRHAQLTVEAGVGKKQKHAVLVQIHLELPHIVEAMDQALGEQESERQVVQAHRRAHKRDQLAPVDIKHPGGLGDHRASHRRGDRTVILDIGKLANRIGHAFRCSLCAARSRRRASGLCCTIRAHRRAGSELARPAIHGGAADPAWPHGTAK